MKKNTIFGMIIITAGIFLANQHFQTPILTVASVVAAAATIGVVVVDLVKK